MIVQMLDKLISNAVQFSTDDHDIEMSLNRTQNHYEICVTNKGPTLPEDMGSQIFNSMISVREKSNTGEPHLGLGLFIVRLIAEFHGGVARAENLPNEDGVTIIVTIAAPPG